MHKHKNNNKIKFEKPSVLFKKFWIGCKHSTILLTHLIKQNQQTTKSLHTFTNTIYWWWKFNFFLFCYLTSVAHIYNFFFDEWFSFKQRTSWFVILILRLTLFRLGHITHSYFHLWTLNNKLFSRSSTVVCLLCVCYP